MPEQETFTEASSIYKYDYQDRINPGLMNELMHKSVPVLKHTGWRITEVGLGYAETILPLNAQTTNQHGTHQAALISLSADYTGGMALTSVLTGVPLSGVHRCKRDEAASLWLASMNVKYINPSTDHLVGFCQIDQETINKIRKRYFTGKRILVPLTIHFRSSTETIAEAELRYFAQPTKQVMARTGRPSTLFQQKIKASARMIAGVRASSSTRPSAKSSYSQNEKTGTFERLDCPHAEAAAGAHGKLLANRLNSMLPQLSEMVLARTRHIDQTIESMPELKQVVMLGAGLDMRPFRFLALHDGLKFFEVDLPEMLEERSRVIGKMNELPNKFLDRRHQIPANFLEDRVSDLLIGHQSFDTSLPTLFVYEGCSMYFDGVHNRDFLADIWQLAEHPQSRIWCDLVTSAVVSGDTDNDGVARFLQQMDEMGETFIFGEDDVRGFFKSIGCTDVKIVTSREVMRSDDLIMDEYRFGVGF